MKRRDFITLLGGAAAAWPHQLGAQQPSNSRRIAFVHSGIPAAKLSESGGVFWIKTFYEELRKLGYAEGINLVVERFSAEGNTSRYESFAAEVVTRAPELIVANQNVLVKALTTATATIPIVGITTDPIAFGLVSNIARPGGNLTGVSVDGGAGLNAKRLQILKEIVPTAMRIAFVTSRRQEVEALGVPILERLLADVTEAELGRALDEMVREKIDAVLVSQGGDFLAHLNRRVGRETPIARYVSVPRLRRSGRARCLCATRGRTRQANGRRRAADPQRRQGRRYSLLATGQMGDDDQPQDGQGTRPLHSTRRAHPGRRGDRISAGFAVIAHSRL